MDAQQPLPQTQPIATITTSAETAYTGDASQQQTKTRFTKAERRQFAKEKKALRLKQQPALRVEKPSRQGGGHVAPQANIDSIMKFLRTNRSQANSAEVESYLRFLSSIRALTIAASKNSETLEQRITRGAPMKAEPSAKKLAKMQKRREIRAEQKSAYLAKKAAKGEQAQEVGQAQTAETAPAAFVEGPPTPNFDEINFDDC